MFFFEPMPPPVSFSGDVVPILAMRCNSCHGDAGGLNTRTYTGLMAGGHLGKIVVAGDAERSLLLQFVDGRRGEAQRMPIGGRALPQEQIEIIRRWIDEGARADSAAASRPLVTLTKIRLPRGKALRLFCRVSTDAYLTITVRDPRNGRVLLAWVATVKALREQGDAGSPGELLHWDIRAGKGWPKSINAELMVEHAAGALGDTEFYTDTLAVHALWAYDAAHRRWSHALLRRFDTRPVRARVRAGC